MKNKFKNEKGAIITLFIVISMLTFLVIVVAAYRTVVRKEQGQVEATGQIRKEYEKRTADDVYSEFIGGNTISIGSKEDFKIMLNVLNGLDDKGDELTEGKLSIQLSNGKWYTLTASSKYTLSNDLDGIDLFAFQKKYEELVESGTGFAFEFVGHTINKAVVGKIKNYNTTLTGGFYGPNNPVVPAGFMPVDLNSNSSWNSKANIKNRISN